MAIRVLIVEDDPINLLVAKKLLEKHFEITSATNGYQALEVIEKFDFDVILMDINLGDDALDGTEVMLKIKANPNKNFIKIYAVTSYALPEDRDRFLNFGFDYYFPKPINKDLIIEKIREDIT